MSDQKETQNMICIRCPQGCQLTVTRLNSGKIEVSGNRCPKGIDYAEQELSDPRRVLTSTVKTIFKDFPRVSVRTDKEVPKGELFEFMDAINSIVIKERVVPGDIAVKDLLGRGVGLVITGDTNPFFGDESEENINAGEKK